MKKVPQIHLSKIYGLFCTCHGVCQSLLAAVGSALGDTGWISNKKQNLQVILTYDTVTQLTC